MKTRERISTTVDRALLAQVRALHPHETMASVVEAALAALLREHRAAQIDADYAAAYAEQPMDTPDEWGDLAAFVDAAARS
ncbi:hypothetical protein [Brevibacterium album]|uniref:hypothetical protein n=1 Tax=Brevibacterium album TaxID=417948 RepID=UPI00048F6BF1|nr:hypothetical protein [Brevibacterium album]